MPQNHQTLASSLLVRRTALDSLQGRSVLGVQNLTQCIWDGVQCGLQNSYVASLPDRLGNASTESAKVLARSALRAALCANLTSQPACLAQAAASGCDWDALTSSCVLADLLDVEALRGVAFCPGGRLDAAASCAALSAQPNASAACAASPFNCTALTGSAALAYATRRAGGSLALRPGYLSGVGDLLGRLWEDLATGIASNWAGSFNVTLPAFNASSVNSTAAESAAGQLAGNASAAINSTVVCVAAWTTDRSFLTSLAKDVLKSIVSGQPALSALVTPQLFGDCNATSRLAAAAAACPAAASQSACDALAGCEWLDAAKACAMGSRLIEDAVLRPTDSWVSLLSNATSVCRSALNASSCTAANGTSLPALPALPSANSLLANVSDALREAAQLGGTVGGGGGGAAGAAAVSVWALLGGLLAAAALPRLGWL